MLFNSLIASSIETIILFVRRTDLFLKFIESMSSINSPILLCIGQVSTLAGLQQHRPSFSSVANVA